MTDYNDGEWHGWNGGECPVHPESIVNGIEPSGAIWITQAKNNDWQSMRGAFRVTSPYVKPKVAREFWMREYAGRYEQSSPMFPTSFKVREVLGDE